MHHNRRLQLPSQIWWTLPIYEWLCKSDMHSGNPGPLFQFKDFHHKEEMVMRPSCLCNENPYSVKMVFFCIEVAPQVFFFGTFWEEDYYTPTSMKLKGGILVSSCPSIRPSIRPSVHLWTESCLLCIFNNTHQFHFIFTHLIKQLQELCCV